MIEPQAASTGERGLDADSCRWRSARPIVADPVDAQRVAAPPLIQGLHATFVEGTAFPMLKWYYASGAWFYHRPATYHRLLAGEQFFELVDPCLKPLCRLAIDAGLCTTPSCQGHFHSRAHFAGVWQKLTAEIADVRGSGLRVRDCEDQCEYLWIDPAFAAPWRDFEEFHEQVRVSQRRGFLGIAIPAERKALIDWLHVHPFESGAGRSHIDAAFSQALGEPVLCATVTPQTPAERDDAWMEITQHLVSALEAERLAGSDV